MNWFWVLFFFLNQETEKSKQFYSDIYFLTYKLLIALGFAKCLRKYSELIQADQPGFEAQPESEIPY